MANFTAADIKRLREITGAGMLNCKNALTEAEGEFDRAVEILRVKGAKDVGKRVARSASNGAVVAELDGSAEGVLVEVNCETDFVAKTDGFRSFIAGIAESVIASNPSDVESLLEAPYAPRPDALVKEVLEETSVTLGEKIEVRRFAHFDDGYIGAYLHKSSPDLPPTVGVLVEFDGEQPVIAKEIAQHIAAMAPKYVTRDEVTADVVETERRIAEETARAEGKPEQAMSKIVQGRVNGFYKDFTLLEQAFVKDNKRTVKQVLDEAGVTVKRFARFKVGQA